jgi:hypothetical protein
MNTGKSASKEIWPSAKLGAENCRSDGRGWRRRRRSFERRRAQITMTTSFCKGRSSSFQDTISDQNMKEFYQYENI